ncbi:alpha/beta hydrolase [Enterococcus raffinosus]|jgi:acetyl esterase|uniref:alpha/beta hydrolase n=1 Tax=Enterococcus raffinosus TaxID=71452 RepID=UPI0007643FE1|nr:alpha/beta hydrolase [Enterococcus raffinosus]MDT2573575.1 alpha/beta hydrolase [Enterococcus raffinosus]OJG83803.1 alpha/beta hydrolase [Enterococcus raffinosus]QXJ60887.1 alpha/beta hydrolase [Enterococcus raffinosus]
MLEEDKTIFDYRLKKEKKYCDMIKQERLKDNIEKISYFSKHCGYIDGYIYRPEGYDYQANLPVVFNFHGGGMVLSYCEQDGIYCQEIANKVGVAVINVDYAVAPEYKFPLPILSAYDFIDQVIENSKRYNLQKNNVLLMGHSAGGYISTALCVLNDTRKKLTIKGLIADYAVLRQDAPPSNRKTTDKDKSIPVSRMEEYFNWYFNKNDDTANPLASPINADGNIFPATLIISAEYDSLKQEEVAFAKKLLKNGVEVEYKEFKDTMHGFTHKWFEEFHGEQSKKAWELMEKFIQSKLFS